MKNRLLNSNRIRRNLFLFPAVPHHSKKPRMVGQRIYEKVRHCSYQAIIPWALPDVPSSRPRVSRLAHAWDAEGAGGIAPDIQVTASFPLTPFKTEFTRGVGEHYRLIENAN